MFIKYQTVRNTVIGTAIAIGCGIGAFVVLRGHDAPTISEPTPSIVMREEMTPSRPSESTRETEVPQAKIPQAEIPQAEIPQAEIPQAEIPQAEIPSPNRSPAATASTSVSLPRASAQIPSAGTPSASSTPQAAEQERYLVAMKIATSKASPDGKGKDVLGPESPWKLNLYDDDLNGQWDRAKLDYDRDEVDDEKWNFKQGRWEKDGGATIWVEDRWVRSADALTAAPPSGIKAAVPATAVPAKTAPANLASNPELDRYREAMKIATSRAKPDGKGKDVLGAASPWKLNLYDDDQDGQWDRAKLDYNRDEVDDEKWNFKNGRWEKDGGATVWNGTQWVPSG